MNRESRRTIPTDTPDFLTRQKAYEAREQILRMRKPRKKPRG